MSLLFESITFGLIVAIMILGIIGVIIPIIPGTLLIWLSITLYVWSKGMAVLGWGSFVLITLIALVTGTADLWLPLLGAKSGGASKRALLLGGIGALLGTFMFPVLGTIVGYALGLLLGEYHKRGDWLEARRASLGGVAGWGVATAIQLGGGLLMLLIFVVRVLLAG